MIGYTIYYSILFISLLFFQACGDLKSENKIVEVVNLIDKPIETGNKVSSLISNISFIKLETTKDCLIGEINKIVQFKEKLFIVDRFNSSTVFVFDTTGKFLFKLGSIGKSHGQYIYPHDLIIDSINGQVLLLDSENNRINKYKIENGDFVSATVIPFVTTRFTKYGNYYGFVGGKTENLILTDKHFTPLMKFFPYEEGLIKSPHESFHNVGDTLLLFQLNYKDTLYKIVKDRVLPYRRIEYGESGISFEDFKNVKKGDNIIEKFKDKKITYRYYFETINTIFFTFLQDRIYYMVIVSKRDGSSKIIPYDKVVNDISFEKNFPIVLSTNSSGFFIASTESNLTDNKINSDSILLKYSSSNNLVSHPINASLNHINNPTLLFFKFK